MQTNERLMTEAEETANDALIEQAAKLADADYGQYGHGDVYTRNWNTAYHRHMDRLKNQPWKPSGKGKP